MLVLSVLPVLNLAVMSVFKIGWKDAKSVWEPVGTGNYAALGGDALFAASLAVVALKPPVVLFLMVFAYAVSGYVLWGLGRRVKAVP